MVSEKHSFSTENAKQYGIVEAILIENLSYWISKNMANGKNIHKVVDGELAGEERCWSYNSIVAFAKIFDYISPKKIRTSLDGLVEKKVLLKGHFSKDKSDRSNWYAFYCEEDFISGKYISAKATHLPNRANALAQQGESIYTDIKHTNIKPTSPLEKKQEDISLLTSDATMYESKQSNIELNCTFPINDVTIPVDKPNKKSKSNFQSNPDKYTWINARVKEFNEGLPKDRQFTRPNKSGKTREEKAGNTHLLGVIYDKFGEEKATEFFNYIVAKGEWRNPYSISSLKNQEEFENFYQDPQEEQPKYLDNQKFDSFKRFKNEQEEPSLGSFYNEDAFYVALEYFYSNQFEGTELVKKVRERVKEINCKYNKY